MEYELMESIAVPFDKINEARNFMTYSSVERVMFEMLIITGCRVSTLEKFKISQLYGEIMYFKEAKTNKTRKTKLPQWFIDEIKKYREKNRCYEDKIFSINAKTFNRYFNRDIRPHLSKDWQRKRPILCGSANKCKYEYILQLKGIRKSYATLEFNKQMRVWNDANIAAEFTAKKLRHSTKKITCMHYLQHYEGLNIPKYGTLSPEAILEEYNQKRILDYC